MPLTDKNKEAVNKEVLKWVDDLGKVAQEGGGFAMMVQKCNDLTEYIMDLCQKAYDKGVIETKNQE